jgi:hypothetical protein
MKKLIRIGKFQWKKHQKSRRSGYSYPDKTTQKPIKQKIFVHQYSLNDEMLWHEKCCRDWGNPT